MATAASKRRRGRKKKGKKKTNTQMVTIGAIMLTVALLAFGIFQFVSNNQTQTTSNSTLAQTEGSSLESISIDGNQAAAVEPIAATDRENRFLGPASDAESVALAEAGRLGQPALLWFHADW